MRILILSYYYLPYKGVGINRVLRFKKYLKKFGEEITVVAPLRNDSQEYDAVFVRVPHIFRKLAGIGLPTMQPHPEKRILLNIFRSVGPILEFISIPDRQIYWLPFAIRRCIKLIRAKKINVIYTTSPPESTHLIGLILKYLTKTVWIAEFRDTWIYDPLKPIIEKSLIRYKIDLFLEKVVVNNADGIVVNSDVAKDYFSKRYLMNNPRKIATIYTGYDPDDFESLKSSSAKGKFRIIHTGSFSLSHYKISINNFLQGLLYAVEKESQLKKDIEVIFVGNLSASEIALIHKYRLTGILKVFTQVEHKKALEYQVNADLLLVINHASNIRTANIHSKLFEYVGAGRPVLALTTKGATEDLVRQYNGFLAPPNNPIEIGNKIIETYNLYRKNQLQHHINLKVRNELTSPRSVLKLINFIKSLLYENEIEIY